MNPDLLNRHAVIAIDTSILIYHLEAHPGYIEYTTQILKAIQSGACRGIVSEITLLGKLGTLPSLNQTTAFSTADKYR